MGNTKISSLIYKNKKANAEEKEKNEINKRNKVLLEFFSTNKIIQRKPTFIKCLRNIDNFYHLVFFPSGDALFLRYNKIYIYNISQGKLLQKIENEKEKEFRKLRIIDNDSFIIFEYREKVKLYKKINNLFQNTITYENEEFVYDIVGLSYNQILLNYENRNVAILKEMPDKYEKINYIRYKKIKNIYYMKSRKLLLIYDDNKVDADLLIYDMKEKNKISLITKIEIYIDKEIKEHKSGDIYSNLAQLDNNNILLTYSFPFYRFDTYIKKNKIPLPIIIININKGTFKKRKVLNMGLSDISIIKKKGLILGTDIFSNLLAFKIDTFDCFLLLKIGMMDYRRIKDNLICTYQFNNNFINIYEIN